MSHASQTGTALPAPGKQCSQEVGQRAGELVEAFLRTIMIPDPAGARGFTAPDMHIRFTGGREMSEPADCSAFNADRYAWVKKRFERTDVVAGATADEAIVYNIGTLHGAWPDGTPFEGNRYVDRYVVRHDKIVQMDVWNDSAEWLLVRAGLADPWTSPMNPAAGAEHAA
ncbi:hypothetical protein VVD49_12890 [Uliginosibacterium sp. H3]|uniref:Nuclear transport factor 2 family protein n=1 Tax=Uliginosibacterium silvisoli TaxID=3114758 RepID=A0ABU6K6K3_9RHOO|nr:hypothetical protein [Uliginosibacterium sp. H3]